jgi:hypothetical protein
LGTLGLSWKELPLAVQLTFKQVLIIASETFQPSNFAVFLKGIELMGFEWFDDQEIGAVVLELIAKLFVQCKPADFLVYLSCLNNAGFEWEILPADLRESIYQVILSHAGAYNPSEFSQFIQR